MPSHFIRHESCDKCGSSDAKAVYSDNSSHCFSCEATVPSQDWLEQNAKDAKSESRVRVKPTERSNMQVQVPSTKPAMTQEQWQEIKQRTQIESNEFRGIRDEVYRLFGVRHSVNEDDEVFEQYYPCTQDGSIVGAKIREVPKNFRSIGRTGADCEMFMAFKFNRGGKYVIITEGEIDALSAYQMLLDYNKGRGGDYETAVVSPTTGANSTKQIAANYRFFDTFDNIILCYDNDKAGLAAIDGIVKVLPKGKVKIMTLRHKDANEYIDNSSEKQFVQDFYNAKTYTPVGVLGSGELYDRILQQASVPKVPFPPFMQRLNEMLVGGLPLGHIVNIAAGTGLGKTAFITEMIYFWLFHSPHKIGIVSMELDAGQYGETILSRHLSRKLSLIKDDDDKQNLLKTDSVKSKAMELFFTPEGQHRFYLLDNRDGSVEEIQDTVEELVVACGCKIVVLDPLQDILDGLSIDEQAVFLKWAKGLIKSHGVTLIFINHIRKAASGGANSARGDGYNEEEIQGSSTIIKSASANILLSRNKYAEEELERNTTKVVLSKNRICGITGPAGEVYYENETHTLHDKEKWMQENMPNSF